jgi:hypothetical protein
MKEVRIGQLYERSKQLVADLDDPALKSRRMKPAAGRLRAEQDKILREIGRLDKGAKDPRGLPPKGPKKPRSRGSTARPRRRSTAWTASRPFRDTFGTRCPLN